ncbi:ATP-grasp domain-containing protein [Entomobacter blattae]|uniref:ATP-grasp domain-containing protein n=1 Tax=Entomobacter blattae TaxID=2762277 RepID=A0A7H1NTY2_9PROT|nr:hypothetical protein [Entomobacter blattae]QNT79242.1 hypothetical protein JGUZn3_20370 [Entomobacter blattae]
MQNFSPLSKPFVVISHIAHNAVIEGFLPSLIHKGHAVVIVTDYAQDHEMRLTHLDNKPQIIECDVFNPLSVLSALIKNRISPAAVFSNSDHLQVVTSLVAEYFRCPSKKWEICFAAKNKAAFRARQQQLGLPMPWSFVVGAGAELPSAIPYPVVAKPVEGVASMDVQLCRNAAELKAFLQNFMPKHQKGIALEAYLEGTLFTLETLGDGVNIAAIGGFDVSLSPPPYFIEKSALWNGPVGIKYRTQALAQIAAFGVGFGVCHSEFIATEAGPVLVEINYRSIGDGREFLLDRLLGRKWFSTILKLYQGVSLPEAMDEGILLYESGIEGAALPVAGIFYGVADHGGILTEVSPSITQEDDDGWWMYRALRKVGDRIVVTHSNKDYIGILQIIAPTQEDLWVQKQVLEKKFGFTVKEEVSA